MPIVTSFDFTTGLLMAQHAASSGSSDVPTALLLLSFGVICLVPLVLLIVLGFASNKVRSALSPGHGSHPNERRYHQTAEYAGTHPALRERNGISFFAMMFLFLIMIPLCLVLSYTLKRSASRVEQQASVRTLAYEKEYKPIEVTGPFDSDEIESSASASGQGWASSDGTSSESVNPSTPSAVPQTAGLNGRSAGAHGHQPEAPVAVPKTEAALRGKLVIKEDHASAHAGASHSHQESVEPQQPSTPGFVSKPVTKERHLRDPLSGRPLWLDDARKKYYGVMHSVVSSQRFATMEEASNQAYEKAHAEIEDRIRAKFPEFSKSTNFQLTNAQLDEIAIHDRYVESMDVSLNPDLTAKMYRVHFLLDLNESTLEKLHPFWRRAEATNRSWVVIRVVSVGFMMLAGLAMLLNVPFVKSRSKSVALSLFAMMAFSSTFFIIEIPGW